MKQILFITGNQRKLEHAKRHLKNCQVNNIDIDLPELQAIDTKEVVKEKAKIAYSIIKKPLIVEDTGVYIKSWNNFPGALIKWFLEHVGNDGIVKMLKHFKDKTAYAQSSICYYDGKTCKIFIDIVHGKIVEPRGEDGHGWNPIFEVKENGLTFAEMKKEEKDPISMRRKAFDKMAKVMEL